MKLLIFVKCMSQASQIHCFVVKTSVCVLVANNIYIYDTLPDLVPFVQFKKREKHPCRNDILLKATFLHGCFSHLLIQIVQIREKGHIEILVWRELNQVFLKRITEVWQLLHVDDILVIQVYPYPFLGKNC